ncbi:MAG TPA: DUF5671 domain-containing protein [Candidatus Saccharimonadia bacterium]
MSDEDIRSNLVSAGWLAQKVDEALKGGDKALLVPPPPPPSAGSPVAGSTQQPIAVVSQRTTRGLEYVIMFLALGVTAISLGEVLHSIVDESFGNTSSFEGLVSYATSALIVALPIFAILFLRLKKAEQGDANLRRDSSRRHAVQLTLIVAFLWGLFRLVTYIYSLLNGGLSNSIGGGGGTVSPVANFLHALITVAIAGGIFAYYWTDEHHKGQE